MAKRKGVTQQAGDATKAALDAVATAGEAALKVADAALEAKLAAECEALGEAMAVQDAVGDDYIEQGRKLGIFPAVQGETESGADYDKRCEAFEAPGARLASWKRGFVRRAALRTTVPFSVFIENETSGACRDAKPGDNPARVRSFHPLDCYGMEAEAFKALPGKASDAGTLKGRVAGSREACQNIGNVRASRAKADARESGRRVEAATGAKGRGARGGNKTLAMDCAVFAKKGATKAGTLGTDKGQLFKAAFAAFIDRLVDGGVLDRSEWDSARKG